MSVPTPGKPCPVCTNDRPLGTFTQTINGVTHKSTTCEALHAAKAGTRT